MAHMGRKAVRTSYYSDTDTLYIELSDRLGFESREVAKDVVLDFGPKGEVLGIEIEHASEKTDVSGIERDGAYGEG